MQPDRHGRQPRTTPDQRRRPDAGFRLIDRTSFVRLADDVLETLPDPVGAALRGAAVRHRDVPPTEDGPDDPIPLVRVEGRAGRATVVEIYRRPLEARAVSALDLAELLRSAVAHEAADVLGLVLGEEWDDDEGW
jgi:hypothetical protein